MVATLRKAHTFPMKKFTLHSSTLRSQQGAAVIEFLVTAVPVLLLGLGATETARWYIHKQHVRLALLEAQRIAAVSHARPERIISGFEEGLKPLFAPAGRHPSIEARRDAYLSDASIKSGTVPWRITIVSPTAAHFKDFSQADLSIARSSGFAAINNNYQAEQHQEKPRGLHSQESIYEANILSVDLVYPYKPLVPGVATLMSLLSSSDSALKQSYHKAGYLPMALSSHIGMQSHPVQWPNSPEAKVVWRDQVAESDRILSSSSEGLQSISDCNGLWCPLSSSQKAAGAIGDFSIPSKGPTTGGGTDNPDRPDYQAPGGEQVATEDPSINHNDNFPWSGDNSNHGSNHLDDPLCGTSLCCVQH